MVNKTKRNFILFLIVIGIIGAIFLIEYLQGLGDGQEEILKCVSEKATLYVSKTCSHCAQQKLILGEGLKYFSIIDCADDSLKCSEDLGDETGRYYIPTWIIDGEKYVGVRSVSELQELTGCQ